jgi:hypothetical protein
MQDQIQPLCNPRDFVVDLLNFVAEQIELAKTNPADQLAAIDAASGVIPLLKSRLDDYRKTSFVLALGNKFDGDTWRKEWDELAAMKSPEEFGSAADALLGTIKILRTDVVAHYP